ncbi:MAG: hypothetical protein WAU89_13410 [Candidatus Acidiferrales bacterium]
MPTTQTATVTKSISTRKSKRHSWKKNGAPLVEVDITELGDKKLNPEESLHRERERALAQASKCKIGGQEELEDAERSAGPRMPWQEVIHRLQLCNRDIRVKDGAPGNIALYFKKRSDEYTEDDLLMLNSPATARAMNIPVPADNFFIHHKYIGGFEMHAMPEYAHISVDTSGLPLREFRSWRSVLIRLIKERIITYQSAIQQFGNPESDQRSGRWFEQLANYRQ